MKKYIIGALIGFILTLGVSAHAEVKSMIGAVIDGSFPITIKGVVLQNPAITIAGVSYVPTREFAETLGATVKFDANLGIEVVPSSSIPAQTPKPKPTKEQITLQIELVKEDIDTLKRQISIGHDLAEDIQNKLKVKLTDKEKEIADLQSQLTALLAQP